jgi:hypothetical protein
MIDGDEGNSKHLSTGLLILGGGVFVFGQLCPLFIPFVAVSDLSIPLKTSISGLLGFGIPELFMLVSLAILGKSSLNSIKAKILTPFAH